MRYLSLFSGIEAATVAWAPLGWQCVGVAEIEPFPCAVLAHHYPDVANLGSVLDITAEAVAALGHIDIVVGGSPCQDLSVAGKRAGLAGARSSLFHEQLRIFNAARTLCGARYLLWENVPGAFSSHAGRDFAVVVGAMAGCEITVPAGGWGSEGVAVGSEGLVEWCVLDAQWFGLAQRRRRIFALLDTGDWANRPPILLEPEGERRDSPPRRTSPEGSTAGADAGAAGGGGRAEEVIVTITARMFNALGSRDVEEGAVIAVDAYNAASTGDLSKTMASRADQDTASLVAWPAQVTCTLNAQFGDKQGLEDQHALHGASLFVMGPTHALRGEGFDASEDGTGRGTPLVPVAFTLRASGGGGDKPHVLAFSCKDHGADAGDISPTLRSMDHYCSHANGGGQVAVAFDTTQITSPSNYSNPQPGDPCHPLAAGAHPPAIAMAYGFQPRIARDAAPCVATSMAVRRLTPREGSRLQGFPDTYLELLYADADEAHAAQVLHELWREAGTPAVEEQGWRIGVVAALLSPEVLLAGVHVGWLSWEMAARCAAARGALPGENHNQQGFVRSLWDAGAAGRSPYQRESFGQSARELGSDLSLLPLEISSARAFLRDSRLWPEAQARWPLRYALAKEKARGTDKPLTPDGPRYKALGNSMAVPCMHWIGKRIHGQVAA